MTPAKRPSVVQGLHRLYCLNPGERRSVEVVIQVHAWLQSRRPVQNPAWWIDLGAFYDTSSASRNELNTDHPAFYLGQPPRQTDRSRYNNEIT